MPLHRNTYTTTPIKRPLSANWIAAAFKGWSHNRVQNAEKPSIIGTMISGRLSYDLRLDLTRSPFKLKKQQNRKSLSQLKTKLYWVP